MSSLKNKYKYMHMEHCSIEQANNLLTSYYWNSAKLKIFIGTSSYHTILPKIPYKNGTSDERTLRLSLSTERNVFEMETILCLIHTQMRSSFSLSRFSQFNFPYNFHNQTPRQLKTLQHSQSPSESLMVLNCVSTNNRIEKKHLNPFSFFFSSIV